jgi:hypothetical protein
MDLCGTSSDYIQPRRINEGQKGYHHLLDCLYLTLTGSVSQHPRCGYFRSQRTTTPYTNRTMIMEDN